MLHDVDVALPRHWYLAQRVYSVLHSSIDVAFEVQHVLT